MGETHLLLKLKMNKGANLLSLWWFFILAIVGTGLVVGTLIFYGAKTDVRQVESDILADRILSCVSDQGSLNQDFIDGKFNIFSNCGLYENLLSSKNKYMIKIQINDSSGNSRDILKYGPDMEIDCRLKSTIMSASKYPFCSTKILYVSDFRGNPLTLRIITGSNYLGGNLYA